MQFADMKGPLGIIIMLFTYTFEFFLVPEKHNILVNGQTGNTALYWYNGKLLALMDAGFPFLMRVCAGVVKSVSEFTFGGNLEHSFGAHPKVDPKTGELLNICYGCAGTPECTYSLARNFVHSVC